MTYLIQFQEPTPRFPPSRRPPRPAGKRVPEAVVFSGQADGVIMRRRIVMA